MILKTFIFFYKSTSEAWKDSRRQNRRRPQELVWCTGCSTWGWCAPITSILPQAWLVFLWDSHLRLRTTPTPKLWASMCRRLSRALPWCLPVVFIQSWEENGISQGDIRMAPDFSVFPSIRSTRITLARCARMSWMYGWQTPLHWTLRLACQHWNTTCSRNTTMLHTTLIEQSRVENQRPNTHSHKHTHTKRLCGTL